MKYNTELLRRAKSMAYSGSLHKFMYRRAQYSRCIWYYSEKLRTLVDAQIIDAKGKPADQQAMEEDYFWAIGGRRGGTFVVTVSWKIKLFPVPSRVTGTVMYLVLQNTCT